MAVRTHDSNTTYFGVIREVLRIPHPLAASQNTEHNNHDNVVYADWFDSSSTRKKPTPLHTHMNVPVIKRSMLARSALGTGNLWSCINIVPVHVTLMPNIVRGGTTEAARTTKQDATAEFVVLSRDSELLQLAHPAWGPNAHAGANLSGEHFRTLRRTKINTNLDEALKIQEEERKNQQHLEDSRIDAWMQGRLNEANN